MMNKRDFLLKTATLSAAAALAACGGGALASTPARTVILVHGAFAGGDGWAAVARTLVAKGLNVVSAANPLRGVASDAAALASLVAAQTGPVVLVGHSYGGMLISNALLDPTKVSALVFVGAFTPDVGESVVDLAGRYPGSTLGDTLSPVALGGGATDLYIAQDKYHQQFCADLPAADAAILATFQRPITEAAILEKSTRANWKQIPSWHIYGTADKNIPAAAMKFMAERANARKTVELAGTSHVPHVSQPAAVAAIITEAAGK